MHSVGLEPTPSEMTTTERSALGHECVCWAVVEAGNSKTCTSFLLGWFQSLLRQRTHGAMATRRIPDPKIGGSIPSGFTFSNFVGIVHAPSSNQQLKHNKSKHNAQHTKHRAHEHNSTPQRTEAQNIKRIKSKTDRQSSTGQHEFLSNPHEERGEVVRFCSGVLKK